MYRIALRNLSAHARRFASTIIAVTVGVAFLSGVLIQVATFQKSFDDMFAVGTAGTDAVVRSDSAVELSFGDTARARLDAATVDRVAAVAGVRTAVGWRSGVAQITGADGEVLGGGGPPQAGEQWIPVPALNPFRLVDGRPPTNVDEVVIDRASARDGDLDVGDTTTILTPEPVAARIVGVASYGSADSAGPVTTALFSEAGASKYLGTPDEVDEILVDAEPGVSQAALVDRLEAAVPDGIEAVTGAELTDEAQQVGRDLASFIRPALLSFAVIALVVGAFSIHNTFAIVVAQRTRDAALLRAVGASRRQVVGGVMLEALVVGGVGAGLGLLGGLGVAKGLGAVMAAFGPSASVDGLVVEPVTVALALGVGGGVTLLAAAVPAWRGAKVAPVAALRDAAVDGGRSGMARLVGGLALLAGGLGLGFQAALGNGEGAANRAGVGAGLVLMAVIALGPLVAGAVAGVLGAPLARLRGVVGVMARRNAVRNPRRTAGTATALVIGVAVVALFTVVGASIQASINRTVDQQVAGDLVVRSGEFGMGGVDQGLVNRLDRLPETGAAVGIGMAPIRVDGEDRLVSVADPAGLDRVIDMGVVEGSVAALDGGGIAVSEGYAEDRHLALGDTVPVRHVDGTSERLAVGLVYRNETLVEDIVVPTPVVTGHVPDVGAQVAVLTAADGVSVDQLERATERTTSRYPTLAVQDRDEYADTVGRSVDQMLVLVYGLLALSIGIALMGIANTLSLSTLERLREIGLLRAVGQSRRQLRSMIRWEAVVVAVFGTVVGLAVGVWSAWAVLRAAASSEINVVVFPGVALAVVLVIGAAAGVVASVRPARRAARTDVLAAIAS